MAQSRFKPGDGAVSPVLAACASLVIVAHFGAVVVRLLAVPSGLSGPAGVMNPAPPPAFAQALNERAALPYLNCIKLAHLYDASGNYPAEPGVYFEVRLKDASGQALLALRFPDPEANAWVRYRQGLLVQGLVPDQPIPPPQGETVPAPHQQVRTVPIWDIIGENRLQLRRVPEHLVPRNRQVFSPTEWSLVLTRSYARYLCRKHGAASAELIRHSRNPPPPTPFLVGEPPAAAFTDLIANYGETSGE